MTSKKSLKFLRIEIKTDVVCEGPLHSLASLLTLEVASSSRTLINVYRTSSILRRVQSYEGGPKKTGFSLKKKIYLHFEQKTLNSLQNTPHSRQYTCPVFFPTVWSISGTAEAWCCWVPPAKLFSPPPRWQISFLSMFFFIVGNKKKSQGARSSE